MATVTYIQKGASIDYTPGADVDAGDVVVQEELVGIAKKDITSGELGALAIEGVFSFPKVTTSGSAIAIGEKCYWDASNVVATTTASTHKLIGKCVKAAADDDALVNIKLNQ